MLTYDIQDGVKCEFYRKKMQAKCEEDEKNNYERLEGLKCDGRNMSELWIGIKMGEKGI